MRTLNVRFQQPQAGSERYERVLTRVCREKAGLAVDFGPWNPEGEREDTLLLAIKPGIGTEGFRIADSPLGIRVTGNDELGLLYGLGKYLHDGSWTEGAFTPGPWRGTSVPQGLMRGMYFAFHQNWYSMAPVQEVQDYIEDLALWGMNSLVLQVHQFEDPNQPEARADFARNASILRHARRLGVRVGLLECPNLAYGYAVTELPAHILGARFPDTDPERRGHYGVRICPSTPEGFAYLSHKLDQYLAGYEDIGLDFVVAFPYDSGGCGCENCWPWGARGYLEISREFSRLAKARYPQSQFVLGTWCYDVREESDGEYEGLEAALAEDTSWVDVIMADSHEEFPAYPLQPGALAGLPLINFAEISMWGRFPWGGSGANPLPERFQRIWDASGHRLAGGFPYSEGNFEDINKVIFLRFFWDGDIPASATVREYLHFEFGAAVELELMEAVYLLEKTLASWTRDRTDAERVHEIMLAVDEKLPRRLAAAWRWQLLYWRAVIDFEIETYQNEPTDRRDAAYEALIAVQHLQDGWSAVTPPSRAYRARLAALNTVADLPPGAEPERDAAKSAGALVQ